MLEPKEVDLLTLVATTHQLYPVLNWEDIKLQLLKDSDPDFDSDSESLFSQLYFIESGEPLLMEIYRICHKVNLGENYDEETRALVAISLLFLDRLAALHENFKNIIERIKRMAVPPDAAALSYAETIPQTAATRTRHSR